MEINQNNDKKNQQQNDLYAMINELRNKYEILEKKQMMNEELAKKNKEVNLNLNIYLKELKNVISDLKQQFEQNIAELKENIHKIKKERDIDKIRTLSLEQINNLENKYCEMRKDIDKKIEILKNEINDIKVNKNKNDINNIINNDNNINIENKNNNYVNIDNNKDSELRIDKIEQKTLFKNLEDLFSTIMDKNNIDNKIKVELNQICEKLIINNISPIEYTANYFSRAYKYLQNGIEKERLEKIKEANKKIILAIEEIENKINKKMKSMKLEKTPNKNVDKIVEEFRKKYSILEEDASDEQIRKYLKQFNNNEKRAYQAIMDIIIYAGKENKPK